MLTRFSFVGLTMMFVSLTSCAFPDDYDYDVDMDVRFRKESPGLDCGSDPERPLACDNPGEIIACSELGYDDGSYATCDHRESGCRYITDSCEGVVCGDGVMEGSEECDYRVPDEIFVRCGAERIEPVARLSCSDDCTVVEEACSYCGDGIVTEYEDAPNHDFYSEECDPADPHRPRVCSEFYGYRTNEPVPCTTTCEHDLSGCTPTWCGDGHFDSRAELCERGTYSGEVACDSLPNFRGDGTAVCESDCTYDTSACHAVQCGDGIVDSPEELCDPEAPRASWCGGMGAPAGEVCNNCQLSEDRCWQGFCGDGRVGGQETCEAERPRSSWICNEGFVVTATTCVDCQTTGCAVVDDGAGCASRAPHGASFAWGVVVLWLASTRRRRAR